MLRRARLHVLWLCVLCVSAAAQFRVPPYVQNPTQREITVLWFSAQDEPGRLACSAPEGGKLVFEGKSTPRLAGALAYSEWEAKRFFDGKAPPPPYLHEVRVKGLEAGTTYRYEVTQGKAAFRSTFRTAPAADAPVRFCVYADSETEPESTGARVNWPDPRKPDAKRPYLVDQTQGYAGHLSVLRQRRPDFIVIAGDICQSGGEQRDWDEFWRHNTAATDAESLADSVCILPALGNHDYYGDPGGDGYGSKKSEGAVAKYLTYFRLPPNGARVRQHEGRYYRFDYGAVTLIALDVNNAPPHGSEKDTNFSMLGEGEQGGGHAPDFHPGSDQHAWLARQLADAQKHSKFTFVTFHQCPYSSGPHGKKPGRGSRDVDWLSGVPVRVLTPLFVRHGVDAVFSGHCEMMERSEVAGQEVLPDGGRRAHVVHFYDVGVGGDGLRGPTPGLENPARKFLAHLDAPEVWKDGRLVEGGKHYGHVEVNVARDAAGVWQAVLTPAYSLPRLDGAKGAAAFERKEYRDIVTLNAR